MAEFILLIREDLTKYPRPEAALQSLINAHRTWAKQLTERGIFKNGYGVGSDGNLLVLQNGTLQVQPIRDMREGVGGLYIIEAPDLAAAIEIAKECPTYMDGDMVEVRPLM